MTKQRTYRSDDPLMWNILLAIVFFTLCLIRLTTPSSIYFDEEHYVPAARTLLALAKPVNVEHPLLGKTLIAAGIALFGDNSFGWRIFSALGGTLALFAGMRAMWFARQTAFASLATGLLLITAFPLFVLSRIAMLDIFMAAFVLASLWMLAAAIRYPDRARFRLVLAGILLGMALGTKWNAAPLAILPGVAFLLLRWRSMGTAFPSPRSLWMTSYGKPIEGISLAEAAMWLGLLPIVIYMLTFSPAFFYAQEPLSPFGLVAHHRHMLALQEQVIAAHPYQSTWWEWVLDLRPIWFLYEPVDGAQRGVFLTGNPLVMWLGIPAFVWCIWAAFRYNRCDCLALAILYATSILFWIVAPKPVQFYYHYLLPSCFLMGALALALDHFWQSANKWLPLTVLSGSLAIFIYFWPILSAAPLENDQAFTAWTWLPRWP
ncbi:phospholipid carrier-dependent glycosyltransferase [Altericroceibacterium endophyticum]|uniref:Polyprenol-phosphate-mannose--protein mannosyltransferase n=1 Tax=Altericroceibacterium endophyticum TaxID=1808508 RepID=A0A6I4T7C1_9SPHN|nr:phospholipid carrier-dependent glycosyltransferase [Altericroceibacterium endophyticum]MXO66132.1 phospholipid carrier-dependent glycosyltransferase [Altericroceibacterium endophyticum]